MTAIKYIAFAVISTLFNLLFQYLGFLFYSDSGALYVAMLFGTLAGLIVKYVLDRRFIFYHEVKDKKDDAKTFVLYFLMGSFTTMIFWGTELGFYYLVSDQDAKYLGAVIGLGIGYAIKYFLDKRFVFIDSEEIAS